MFFEGTTRIVESFLACILILWGSYLLLPVRLRATDVYMSIYRSLVPDTISGLVMLWTGLFFMWALLTRNREWRQRCCMLSGFVYAALWGVYVLAGRASVGLIILPFYALSCAVLYLRPYLIVYARTRLTSAEATNGEPDGNTERSGGHRRDVFAHDRSHQGLVGKAK